MSKEIEKLNGAINVALRSITDVADMIAKLRFEPKSQNLRNVSEAYVAISAVQRAMYESNPELEYHYDESRPATEYMQRIGEKVARAAEFETEGNRDAALEELRKVLSMEPPPLTHEIVMKEVRRLGGDDS